MALGKRRKGRQQELFVAADRIRAGAAVTMATLEEQFNTRLSAFPSGSGMGPTTLGTKAVGDPSLLRQIARGRSPSLRTADRVLAFIAACELDSGGARAPPARPGRPRPGTRASKTERSGSMTEPRGNEPNEAADPLPAGVGGRGPDGLVAEHDLPVVGRGTLPPNDPAGRARGALGRGRGRGVDPRAAGEEPGRGRPGPSTGPSRVSPPASWSPTSRATRASPFAVAVAALSAGRRVPPYRTLGNPRSSILGDSTARRFPEMPLYHPETASEPVGGVRSGLGTRSPARQIRRPVVHEPTPPLEQVGAPVRGLHLVLDHVRQRGLDPRGCPRRTGASSPCADPTRRAILGRLCDEGESSLTTLARGLPMSRQGVSKHLDILVAAGLVEKRVLGRQRLHALRPEPLKEVEDWLAPYAAAWDERLERLRFHLLGE